MVQYDTVITYEEELKQNPELKESDVQMLREWCTKQPHLPKISDVQLIPFLYNNYFSIEATKTNIETYYTMKSHIPELFSNRDPIGPMPRSFYKNAAYAFLEKLTDDRDDIVYAKCMDHDPSHYNFSYLLKYMVMFHDLHLHTKGSHASCVVVYNVQNITLRHVSCFSPMTMKNFMVYVDQAFSRQVKGIHIMNATPVTYVILQMIKPFLMEKFSKMIHIHSTTESLAKYVPLDTLPNDYGGHGGNLADLMAKSVKWLEDNRAWFQTEEATMRVNESLRPGKGKTSTDLFGVEGCFKQWKID